MTDEELKAWVAANVETGFKARIVLLELVRIYSWRTIYAILQANKPKGENPVL